MRSVQFGGTTCPGLLVALCLAFAVPPAFSHCDGMDGPVVTAARLALDSSQVERVLVWVPASEEKNVKEVFRKTMAVRKLGPEAKELADLHFYETVVRIHRASEGAPYDGLKPANRDLGPAIPMADEAMKSGKIDRLAGLLETDVRNGLKQRFDEAFSKSRHGRKEVARGREFVAGYVEFIHYVEKVHQSAAGSPHGHFKEEIPKHSEGETPSH